MSILLMSVLNSLVYATLGVTVTAIAIWLLLRWCRVQSPAIQRFAWLLVLVPGVIVWRMSMVLPVLPAQNVARADIGPEHRIAPRISDRVWSAPSLYEPADQPTISAPPRHTYNDLGCAILLVAWITGMLILAVRSARSYLAFVRQLPLPLPPAILWVKELQDISDELSIRRSITLHVTHRLGPALCLVPHGYRLLVPQAAWQSLSAEQRRAVLRHELAHYVRGDLWKSLLARILAWPQWFNPMAWLAVRRFDEAAEWACDDAVVAAEREHAFDYLRALLELGTTEFSTPTLQAAVHGGSLQCRVRRLLSPTGKDSLMKKFVVIVAALALAAGGFARIRLASAQPSAPPVTEPAATSASDDAVVNSKDADRVATATPARPSQEAYIDLIRIFKEEVAFQRKMSAIKDQIKKVDQEVKQQQTKLSALRDELKDTSDEERRLQLQKELADESAKLQAHVAETKKQFLEAEAQVYNEVYEQVRLAVAEYAKEHGIRRVTRSQLIAFTDEKVVATDRKAVLERVNRPILYLAGPSESPSDITDAILERLNAVKTR